MPSSAYQADGIDTAVPEAPCDSPAPTQSPSRSCNPVGIDIAYQADVRRGCPLCSK